MELAMRQNRHPLKATARAAGILALLLVLTSATVAEARLFWQTYGSTLPAAGDCGPAANGCGCTWNWNQDYFVPRYPSSGRYDMFSPCSSRPSCGYGCNAPSGCYPEIISEAMMMDQVVEMRPLPNVEIPGMEISGSIPVEGDELFASSDLSALENDLQGKKLLIGPQTILPGK